MAQDSHSDISETPFPELVRLCNQYNLDATVRTAAIHTLPFAQDIYEEFEKMRTQGLHMGGMMGININIKPNIWAYFYRTPRKTMRKAFAALLKLSEDKAKSEEIDTFIEEYEQLDGAGMDALKEGWQEAVQTIVEQKDMAKINGLIVFMYYSFFLSGFALPCALLYGKGPMVLLRQARQLSNAGYTDPIKRKQAIKAFDQLLRLDKSILSADKHLQLAWYNIITIGTEQERKQLYKAISGKPKAADYKRDRLKRRLAALLRIAANISDSELTYQQAQALFNATAIDLGQRFDADVGTIDNDAFERSVRKEQKLLKKLIVQIIPPDYQSKVAEVL